jgi:pyrroline-5-carboxylate reductase
MRACDQGATCTFLKNHVCVVAHPPHPHPSALRPLNQQARHSDLWFSIMTGWWSMKVMEHDLLNHQQVVVTMPNR